MSLATRMRLLLLVLTLVGDQAIFAQSPIKLDVGAKLPSLQGQTLDDKEIILPDAAAGRISLVIFTFSKAAGDRSRVWQDHFVKSFPEAATPEAGAAQNSRITSYSVAMLSDAPGFVRGMIRSAMRKGTPPALRSRTITVLTDSKPWKQRVEMSNDKDDYLFLLDTKGQVVWIYHGEFGDKPDQELKAKITELLSGQKK